MKVHFGQSLQDNQELGPCGIIEELNWSFQFRNQKYFIPNAYRFSEGITLDIIVVLDTNIIKNYINKYKELDGNANEEEYHLIQKENPIPELYINKVYINNELAEISGQSSGMYIYGFEEFCLDGLREIYGHYHYLQEEASFKVTRLHIKFLKQHQVSIEKFVIAPVQTKTLFPIIRHFTIDMMTAYNPYQEILFIHPVSNATHIVAINEVQKFDISSMNPSFTDSQNITTISYELIPALAEGEELIIKDIEVKTKEGYKKINYDQPCPGIGLYYEGKLGLRGYPLQFAATKPVSEDIENITMSIIGIEKEEVCEEIFAYAANDDKAYSKVEE